MGGEIPFTFFGELRQHFVNADSKMHYFRHWYRSCTDAGDTAFSAEVAFELDEKRILGNPKGHAVQSLDPESGPLSDVEITLLLNALRAAQGVGNIALSEKAALWLCITLGSNPAQLALLREEDIEILTESGRTFIQVKVPRIKKRHPAPRTEFKTRKLTPEIGKIVLDLIDQNRQSREVNGWPDERYERPIFVRSAPRPDPVTGPMAQYAMHLYSYEFTDLVKRAATRLKIISPRTRKPLKLSPRRLRYTFANRLVREGASMQEVAEALDHSDLQNVRVYFDIKSDVVDSLDRAMAVALGPVAQAFLGHIVSNAATAKRGDDPRSQVKLLDKSTGELESLGTCGEHSFCGLFAPVACYTCRQFQPWIDGPHDKILAGLLARRDRKLAAGQDERLVSIYDTTILAIGNVIAQIEALRVSEGR